MNDYYLLQEKVKKYASEFYKIVADIEGDFEFKEEFLFSYVGSILSAFLAIKNSYFLIPLSKNVEKDIIEKFKNLQEGVIKKMKLVEKEIISPRKEELSMIIKLHRAFDSIDIDIESCIIEGKFVLNKQQMIKLKKELKKIEVPTKVLDDFIVKFNNETIH